MSKSERVYNLDLAPTSKDKKNWGWFEIFNVWANDVQSLFGYTLAASLFLYSGLNGWAVFAALILAGFSFPGWLIYQASQVLCMAYPILFSRVSAWAFSAQIFWRWHAALLQCFGMVRKPMRHPLLWRY
jgi:NCS1 family nucleobase:cation symporter-1